MKIGGAGDTVKSSRVYCNGGHAAIVSEFVIVGGETDEGNTSVCVVSPTV